MKKLFDKYIAQSTRAQIVALALAFLVLVVVGGFVGRSIASADNDANLTAFGRPEAWGFIQCIDMGSLHSAIENNTVMDGDKVKEPVPMSIFLITLFFALGGMVLVSFFTGAATDFLGSRREKILKGEVAYKFNRKYVLVVGHDFQVDNLVQILLEERRDCDVVLITDTSVEDIYEDILPEIQDSNILKPADARRLYIMRKDIAVENTYEGFQIGGAEEIYLIGDEGSVGRDGRVLQALELLAKKVASESRNDGQKQVKVYMHIEDSVLYSQVRAMKLPADDQFILTGKSVTAFDLEVFNYYESWAWECWSKKDSMDRSEEKARILDAAEDAYLPLRHRKDSRDVELFVIGAGRMGRAMVNFAIPLLNYGEDSKHSRITVFDLDASKKGFLADGEILSALPEVEVRFAEMDGCSDEANELMLEAAKKPGTSVTVVVALSDPGAAIRACSELSNRLRRENVSVLVWQSTESTNCPSRRFLKMGGPGDAKCPNRADRTTVRYFGMTDVLPWKDPARFDYGMAVNYFYECWFPYGQEYPKSPKVTDANFTMVAKSMWNQDDPAASQTGYVVAGEKWDATRRWKKWASVNSGDVFKERSAIFKGTQYQEVAEKLLKAEHNRWWTEKLLSGWCYDSEVAANDESHADKSRMLHGDMVPFEQLSEIVKDKDKINLAAMAACGFAGV